MANLFEAAWIGDPSTLADALEAGADPSHSTSQGFGATMLVKLQGKAPLSRQLVPLLRPQRQHDPEDPCGDWTPTMIASCAGNLDCLAALVAAGADVNARDKMGWSALMFAATSGHDDCLALLIAAGADIDARDHEGRTVAMHAACAPGFAHHGQEACLRALCDAGCDFSTSTYQGQTFLTWGQKHCSESIAVLLLSLGEARELALASKPSTTCSDAHALRI